MSLYEALHGRAAMVEVGAPWPTMVSSPERKDRGRHGEGGCRRGGRHGDSALLLRSVLCVLYVREGKKEEGERRRKRKGRKRKEKIWKKISNLKIF
jgi:hypothetical protein